MIKITNLIKVMGLEDPFDGEGNNPDGTISWNIWDNLPNIIGAMVTIAFVMVTIFLVWGGMQYIMAGGDNGKQKSAKKTISNAIIGMIIVLFSWGLQQGIKSIIKGINNGV